MTGCEGVMEKVGDGFSSASKSVAAIGQAVTTHLYNVLIFRV